MRKQQKVRQLGLLPQLEFTHGHSTITSKQPDPIVVSFESKEDKQVVQGRLQVLTLHLEETVVLVIITVKEI